MSLVEIFAALGSDDPVLLSLLGGSICAFFNLLGATPVILVRKVSEKVLNTGLGFSAGIMLGASFTSLIVPGTKIGGATPVLLGILLGAVIVTLADRLLPHMHLIVGREELKSRRIKVRA
jgi:ZIP family zinc transporter